MPPPSYGISARLISASGNIADGFLRALQLHDDSSAKAFTAEDLSEISRQRGLRNRNLEFLEVPLSVEAAKTPGWRTSEDLHKKLISIGAFHITKEHLESMILIEREVKAEPGPTVLGRQSGSYESEESVGEMFVFTVAFLIIWDMVDPVNLWAPKKPGTERHVHDVLTNESRDLPRASDAQEQIDQA